MKSIKIAVITGMALSICAHAALVWSASPAHACQADNMTLKLDDQDGEFDGMSLVLRNTDYAACSLGAVPELVFEDAGHHPLDAERRIPRGMHPGPVLLPVTLSQGKEAESQLHWMASDVFEGGNCIRPAWLSVTLEGKSLDVPFGRTMCAPPGSTVYFDQQPLGARNE